jgi:hypothetical protein
MLDYNSIYANSPNCKFIENSASFDGGSLRIINNSTYTNSENCTFS